MNTAAPTPTKKDEYYRLATEHRIAVQAGDFAKAKEIGKALDQVTQS